MSAQPFPQHYGLGTPKPVTGNRVKKALGHQLADNSICSSHLELRGLFLGVRATQFGERRLTPPGICSLSWQLL